MRNRQKSVVAVGGALLSLEKANVILRLFYWVASAIAIAFGLHDGSDYPPLEVVVKDARTSHVVLRDGPHMGIDSAYPVLELFAEEIEESGLEQFLAGRRQRVHG